MKKFISIVLLFLLSGFKLFARADSLFYDKAKINPKNLDIKPSDVYTGKDFIYEKPIEEPSFLTKIISWIYTKFIELINKLFDFNLRAGTDSGRQALWYSLIFILIILLIIGGIFFYKKFTNSLGRSDKKKILC